MKNDEIRAANRKALPKFLLLTLVGAVIGGVTGYCAARYGLDQLSGVLADAGTFFGTHIAPWLMVALAVVTPAVCIPMYRHAKALLASWDGEDEDVSSVIDGKLSAALWLSSASLVLAFFLIAATYSVGFAAFDSWESTVLIFIGIAAFLVILVESILIQQKCVDAAKQMSPEKKASIYDLQFQKSGLTTATKPRNHDWQVRLQGVFRRQSRLRDCSDCACHLRDCIRHRLPAFAGGVHHLDGQSLCLLQGSHALRQGGQ